jgi:hypothetical protein
MSLDGTWHIVATSLPFWRSRQAPSVTYTPLPDGRILDVVHYTTRGRSRLVIGADTLVDGGYHWRGLTPLTRLTSSRWRVVAEDQGASDPAAQWAVTAFEKTLFTPAGVDVYCRARAIDPAASEAARAAIAADPGVASFLSGLFTPALG